MKLRQKDSPNGQIVNYSNRDFYSKYLSDISKYKPLTLEEEVALFEKIKQDGDKQAIEKIMKHNLLFVVSVARHYSVALTSSSLTLEDLINEGNIGLYEAIAGYDPSKGFKFISYAVWHIRKCILKSMNDNVKTIRVPTGIRNEILKIKKKESSLVQMYERPVSTVEIFEAMLKDGEVKQNDTIERFDNILKMYNFEKSLSTKASDDGDMELSDMITSDSPSALDNILCDEKKNLTLALLNKIPIQDRYIIKEHFGIDTNVPLTFNEIAEKYNKTPREVKAIFNKYLIYFKRSFRSSRPSFLLDN
jgi:RNA polymerase primary sigma factor